MNNLRADIFSITAWDARVYHYQYQEISNWFLKRISIHGDIYDSIKENYKKRQTLDKLVDYIKIQ